MSDTVAALERGKAAVVVITEEFKGLANVVGNLLGWPGMRTVMLPYPLTERSDSELQEIARDHLDELLRVIGVS